MDLLIVLRDLLLVAGIILFIVGTLIFFIPDLIVKWNSIGNIWLGDQESAEKFAATKKLFSADYAIFSNHRLTGGIMWGLSSLFMIIYYVSSSH